MKFGVFALGVTVGTLCALIAPGVVGVLFCFGVSFAVTFIASAVLEGRD